MNILKTLTDGLVEAGILNHYANPDDLRAILPAEVVSQVETFEKSAGSAESQEKDMADDPAQVESLDEARSRIADLEGQVEQLTKQLAPGDEALDADGEMVEAVLKSIDPAVAQFLRKQRDDLRDTQTQLAIERSERFRKEFQELADTYVHLSKGDDEGMLAEVLQEVAAFSSDTALKLEGILDVAESRLEAAEEQLTKSFLFNEIGINVNGDSGDALQKATSIAKALVEKGEATSIEAARALVWETNPELYAEYQQEHSLR